MEKYPHYMQTHGKYPHYMQIKNPGKTKLKIPTKK